MNKYKSVSITETVDDDIYQQLQYRFTLKGIQFKQNKTNRKIFFCIYLCASVSVVSVSLWLYSRMLLFKFQS